MDQHPELVKLAEALHNVNDRLAAVEEVMPDSEGTAIIHDTHDMLVSLADAFLDNPEATVEDLAAASDEAFQALLRRFLTYHPDASAA